MKFLKNNWIGTCACGFTVSTPHGKEDATDMMIYHRKKIHNMEATAEDVEKEIRRQDLIEEEKEMYSPVTTT